MQVRFRLRTILIATAVISPLLASLSIVARHGGISQFQSHHARIAYAHWTISADYRVQANDLKRQGGNPDSVDRLDRLFRYHRRQADWHAFLSGRRVRRVKL
jgi:hypothetical protein